MHIQASLQWHSYFLSVWKLLFLPGIEDMLCPRFFGSSSQRGLTFSWSQSLRWVYSSPLTTQATWPQNLAGCCAALELSSSLLTWSQTPYFLLSTPSSATRTDTTASVYPQVATSIDLKHLLTWSQLQANPVLRNSAGGPNHVFP